jgi:hypothetical protein
MSYQYKIDERLIDEIQDKYARVMDNAGVNVADPLAANIGFFNNSGKVYADPMKLGRTMIFFTRPNLNFRSMRNFEKSRIFSYYRSNPLGSTIMRTLMFPEIADEMYYGIYGDDNNKIPMIGTCYDLIIGGDKLIEGEHCLPLAKTNFIPLLSNACISTGNGKDIILDTFETDGNFSGDKLKYAGGIDEYLTVGELNCEFEDMYHSPLLIIFYLWIMYMHYVGKAICDPEWAYIVHRIIDYSCSIYIFMLGTDNQTIIRWVRYGGCFPISIPFGAIQHNKEPNVEELRRMTVPFAYNFMCPMDPVVLTEFNIVSGPSLYYRLKTVYKLDDKDINKIIGEHNLTMGGVETLLMKYPPIYDNTGINDQLPLKRLDTLGMKNTGDENNEGPPSPLLINRQNGYIVNNFYGVPYITEGNKLMFV